MSFPGPEYVKSFLNDRFHRRRSDEENLLEDAERQDDIAVYSDNQGNLEGFEVSNSKNGQIGSQIPKSVMSKESKYNSRTPLSQGKNTSNQYGTSREVASSNHKDSKSAYQKEMPAASSANLESKNNNGKAFAVIDVERQGSETGLFSMLERKSDTCDGHDIPRDLTSDFSHGSEDSEVESEHCHDDSDEKEVKDNKKRKKALKKLVVATVLCFLFMCGEILGGYLANSLAVMTDASHLLTDVSSFMVSIIALQMAARPSSKYMTFGWHRAEVIGAITSVLAIWVVTGVLVYLAVMRIINNEYKLDGKAMLITASAAVVFNIIMGCVLHESGGGHSHGGHSHGHGHGHGHEHSDDSDDGHNEESGNVNVRAAFIHVLGDLLQSLGVLIAAFIIYFKPEYKIADPICTFLFSILVLATTITILRDTIVILMEGTPANINYEKVKERLLKLPGVIAVHDLRIWSLTLNQCVMSCHLAVDKSARPGAILTQATRTMKAAYNFHSMTIQVETYSLVMNDCKKCKPKV